MFKTMSPVNMGEAEMGAGRRKSEILAITGKITKALHEFDTLFLTSHDDEMVNDITSQIECLESGPLKYQLNDFVMRFKEVSAAADQSCMERNEVLESVMQWFNGQQFSQEFEEIGVDDDIDQSSLALRDELVTTRIGFDKLQKLNEEMVAMKEVGADVGHLERERASLRQHAIMNFKSFKRASLQVKDARELGDIQTKKDQMGEIWKNAAGEICGLLKRVRKDGVDYMEELEKKVRLLTTDMEEKAYYFEKMKRKLKEYKLLEEKWKDDNMSLIDQKALTKKKMGKYRRELKKALESLAKYERVSVPKFLKEDDTEESKEAAPLKTALEEEARQKEVAAQPLPVGGMNDPTILRAQLKDCRNQIEQLRGEGEVMNQEMSQLKETLEDLEDDVLRLEKDKTELMHQMKQNSLRPDTRRLSVGMEDRKASKVLSSSLTIIKLKGVESGADNKKRCCKCGLKVSTPPPSETHTAVSEKEEQRDTGEQETEGEEMVEGTPSVVVDVKLNQDEKLDSLNSKCEALEKQVVELTERLEQAEKQKPAETQITKIVYEQVQNDEVTSIPEKPADVKVQEVQPVAEVPLPREVAQSIPPEPTPPTGTDPFFNNLTAKAKGPWEAIVVCNKSIQTDSDINPLGPLSQRGQQGLGSAWAPPPPPTDWVEFDPTMPSPTVTVPPTPKEEPLRQAMLGGMEPAEVKQEAIDCANLVQRELGRMTQGIRGFMDFTNTLVDRETRIIASTNRELKSRLSHNEIQRINQEMQKKSNSSLVSEEDTNIQTNRHVGMFTDHMGSNQPGSIFLESQLPIEERVKNQLKTLAQHSTDILKHAYDLVAGTLSDQQREYEHIYQTLNERQSKPEGEAAQILDVEDIEQGELRPKQSRSHTDTTKTDPTKKTVTLTRSQSHTDFINRHVKFEQEEQPYSPSRMQVTSAMSKAALPKEEVNLAKATISRHGQIILSTSPVAKSSLNMGIGKPVTDTVHRKVKPAPLSHSKLKQKQDALIRGDVQRSDFKATRLNQRHLRNKVGRGGARGASPADRRGTPQDRSMSGKRGALGGHGKMVLTEFELPSDFFSEYTVAELEQTAMQYASQQKQHFHNEMLDKVHFPTLNKEGVITRQQTPQADDRFPRITL